MISLFNLKCFFCNLIVLQCIYITTILKTFKCGSEQKILTVEELRRNVFLTHIFLPQFLISGLKFYTIFILSLTRFYFLFVSFSFLFDY